MLKNLSYLEKSLLVIIGIIAVSLFGVGGMLVAQNLIDSRAHLLPTSNSDRPTLPPIWTPTNSVITETLINDTPIPTNTENVLDQQLYLKDASE